MRDDPTLRVGPPGSAGARLGGHQAAIGHAPVGKFDRRHPQDPGDADQEFAVGLAPLHEGVAVHREAERSPLTLDDEGEVAVSLLIPADTRVIRQHGVEVFYRGNQWDHMAPYAGDRRPSCAGKVTERPLCSRAAVVRSEPDASWVLRECEAAN